MFLEKRVIRSEKASVAAIHTFVEVGSCHERELCEMPPLEGFRGQTRVHTTRTIECWRPWEVFSGLGHASSYTREHGGGICRSQTIKGFPRGRQCCTLWYSSNKVLPVGFSALRFIGEWSTGMARLENLQEVSGDK
jgi:hypothetical protein